ncbi:acid sphingomyelinase-like phosphodiesterase 3b [Mercenaria mercenaria]|uniref:acid sphingomyelinase-like phosphodiesterase 3b n=1 Tax=Mercenaria mercenaria TaxID=6596 RepID=UPI00234ECFFE|nr:acid sphingomyelinase-like phosphodiesterase 3b [Mercenaria mercenaria]
MQRVQNRVNVGLITFFSVLLLTSAVQNVKNTGYFWQVTDFHYDANYSTTGDPNNMCHQGNSSSPSNIGFYGNYLCDAPWQLITSAVQAMYKIEPNPDFIVWTGDSVPHVYNKDLDLDKVYTLIGNVTEELMVVFPNTTIYPVLGNHDPYPANMMPYDVEHSKYYKGILDVSGWHAVLGQNESEQFHNGGYYSSHISEKIKLLGLNTNLYYDQDKLTKGLTDPANQLKWIEDQLEAARKKNEQVFIVAHVPPGMFELVEGMSWFYGDYNKKYLEVMEKYSDVIIAQLYGHEHTDSFRVQFDKEGRPISALFLSPAVTPWKSTLPGVGANNPSIRLFQFDREKGGLKKYIQYFLNLTAANLARDPSKWEKEYDTSDVYAIDELRPGAVHTVVKGFSDKENKVFRRYLDFNSVKWQVNPDCNETCFLRHICAISELDFDNYKTCMAGGKTTKHPETTTRHHPHAHSTPEPQVPDYMYYIIGSLAAALFVLFLVVAVMCFKRGRRISAPRYAKFGSLSINTPNV